MNLNELRASLRGDVVEPGAADYADAADALIFNGRKPAQRPCAVVRPACVEDVQAAVRFAARTGLTVSARGSGHGWSGVAVQEGIVLDLSALDDIQIDAAARIAEVGAAAKNGALAERLSEHGLAFPFGHCAGVSLSGYLLGGGIGWNIGQWGIACFSVEGADVVTADGALRRASATENPELFWAVRGAGPAFFGVVVRYRLRLQPLPRAIMLASWTYPLDRIAEVERWMTGSIAVAPRNVEFSVKMLTVPGAGKVAVGVATVFADTEDEARTTLARIADWAPAAAIASQEPMPVTFASLFAIVGQLEPDGSRAGHDTFWSDDAASTFALMARQIEAAPSPESVAIGLVLRARLAGPGAMPDAAFSRYGTAFGELHACWHDPAQDARNLDWLRSGADDVAQVTTGHYVNGADLERPGWLEGCYGSAALARLNVLRAAYDPRGLFKRARPQSAVATATAVAAE